MQSTRMKTTYTDLEETRKTNLAFCATMDPSKTHEGKIYSDLCRQFITIYNKGNIYI